MRFPLRFPFHLLLVPLLLVPLLLATGCRGEAGDDLPVELRVSVAPTPPVVGPALLVVELTDGDGDPVDGVQVRVEGTMTHAGMVPVWADAEPTGDGRYRVPDFTFTMGGDWILRVHLTLPDGRTGIREREIRVVSAPGGGDGEGGLQE